MIKEFSLERGGGGLKKRILQQDRGFLSKFQYLALNDSVNRTTILGQHLIATT